MNYSTKSRIHHLKARLALLNKLEKHIGEARIGDYISIGDQCFWLSVEESLTVIDALRENINDAIKDLQR